MTEQQKGVSRRGVMKGLAGVAAGGALAPAWASESGPEFDREVDVVVVGSGTGLCAALLAAEAGLSVLVLEKSPAPGGTTVVSGGVQWVPNNYVMKREGLSDSREQALTYLRHLAQGQADEELLEAFVDNGSEMLQFVEQHSDLRWRVSTLMKAVSDYHPTWKGTTVRGRSIEPVMPQPGLAGGILLAGLMAAAQSRGAELLTATPARRLIARHTEQGAEVLGIEAEHQGKPLRIRARRGVLMAAGGFERNAEMIRHFLRGPTPYTLGAETNEGDGIHMGMALGADLRNMNECWGMVVYKEDAEANGDRRGGISLYGQIERRYPGGLCVNRYGERFANEAADYDSTWRSFHTWENWLETGYRNLPAFQVFDHSVRESQTIAGRTKDQALPDWVVQADSLEELAHKLGIDPAGLTATVRRFNSFARQGQDPDFHRGESPYDTEGRPPQATLAPLEKGPFYGAEVSVAALGTCGGLRVDGRARVRDVFGQPIKGLYASGNCSGVGGPGALYGGGGGTLGPAMTFAYIAGKELVAAG